MTAKRIAISGGPGGGKSTLHRALAEAHEGRVVAVPEVATLLLQHLFPSIGTQGEREALQRAIFRVQHELESYYESRLLPGQLLLCDRGTPDGGGYWPAGHDAFFSAVQSSWEHELARYDAVLFLETAAAGGLSIAGGNPVRNEDRATAVAIDRRLHAVWSRHPRFHHVAYAASFDDKLARARAEAAQLIDAVLRG